MTEDRFILNEEEWERVHNESGAETGTAEPSSNGLTGEDPSGCVTVTVTPTNEVVAVRLASSWRDTIETASLGTSVISAANSATARVLARKTAQTEIDATEPAFPDLTGSHAQQDSPADESPLTAEDAMRLVDAAISDLDEFMQQMSTITDQQTNVQSSGGHVSAAGKLGHITDLEIDPTWAATAQDKDIEAEITEVLTRIIGQSATEELSRRPQSANISELIRLVSDPQKLLYRVGLTGRNHPTDQGTIHD